MLLLLLLLLLLLASPPADGIRGDSAKERKGKSEGG
jgi:hypothetical protein